MARAHDRNPALEHLQALAEMAEGIASRSRGLTAASQAPDPGAESEILEIALGCLDRTVHPDRAAVILYDLDGELRFKAWRNLSEEYRSKMEELSPWARSEKKSAPLVLPDVASAPGIDALRATILREGIRSTVLLPITSGGSLLGRLSIHFNEPHPFSEEELHAGRMIAAQIALGIEKTRAKEETRREHRDTDDQKRIAERLSDANHAKDEFLAVLAHELRNPLNPIRSAVHVMNHEGVDHASLERARGIIDRQVRHMARLVDDLLDLSRIARGQILLRRETVDLLPLVNSTVEDHRSEIERCGHTVLLDLPKEPLWVNGDPTRLAQMVGNILQNANKFTEAGGTIRVRVRCVPENGIVTLSILDRGIGIEPRMLDRVFDTFAQANRSFERRGGGLGLGLALVKGLVQLHGGSVHAYSEGLGKGSEFSIRLPLCSAPVPRPAETTHELPNTRHCRVLVVEDNPDSGLGMELTLKLAGHVVKLACTGEEGVELAREFHPDVVLCDIGLDGGMDGYAVARALRSDPECAGSHLVAVTGYGREDDVRQAREAGFDVHLTKPIDPRGMDTMLRGIAARLPTAQA